MNTVNIKLYDIFRKDLHLPDDKARELVGAIDEVMKEGHAETLNQVATKEDTHRIEQEIHRMELKIEQTKGELLKAMFWTGLIQFLAIVGSIIGVITFMLKK